MTRIFNDMPWRVFVTTRAGAVITDLEHRGTDRQFLFTLNGPAYHTGQAAADDVNLNRPYPSADSPANLTNNRRLCYAVRRELHADPPYVCRFGGIFQSLEDQGADAPTTRYVAYDPWQLLMSRPARHKDTGALLNEKGCTYPTGTRASYIALDQLEWSELNDGESHIDYLTNPYIIDDTTPLPAPFEINQTDSVGQVWQNLCDTGTIDIRLDPIYDPMSRPGKLAELRIAQFIGTTRFSIVMGWDRFPYSVVEVNRTIEGMANSIRFLAGAAAHAVPQTDATSITANGKYWLQQGVGGQMHQKKADLLALGELMIRRNGQRTITYTPISDRIVDARPFFDYDLGDYLPLWASRNLREPLEVDYAAYLADPDFPGAAGYQRVYGIPITLDDNGVERVEGLITSQDSPVG
jgi:hypothetical protein